MLRVLLSFAVLLLLRVPAHAADPVDGVWYGVGDQGGGQRWTIVMTIQDGDSRIDYASIPCDGTLTPLRREGAARIYRERITGNRERCVDGGSVQVELQANGTLAWWWKSAEGKMDVRTTLTRGTAPAEARAAALGMLQGQKAAPAAKAASAPPAATPAAPSWNADAQFPDRIDIPDAFAIRTTQGCRLINPVPQPNETASWSGACRNGLAEGPGTVTWMQNGVVSSTSTGHYERGWDMTPFINDWPNVLVRSPAQRDCMLIVPISGLLGLAGRFDVQYNGRCPSNASTLIHEDRWDVQARVFFDGKLFATFDGRVTKAAIPVAGTMTFFGGTRFVFTDKVSFVGLLTPTVTNAWRNNINAVHAVTGKKSPALDNAFNIQIGFNAEPRPPSEVRGKVLSFSVEGFTGASKTSMRYAVSPARNAGLKGASYTIALKTRIDIRETTSMGGFGVGESRSIYQNVNIRVTKADGYRAKGVANLTELDSYNHALGVTRRIESAVPSVEIVAITED